MMWRMFSLASDGCRYNIQGCNSYEVYDGSLTEFLYECVRRYLRM